VLALWAMNPLLEHRLGLVELELGLEVLNVAREIAAVGAASSIDEVERLVNNLLTSIAPVSQLR